MLYLYLKTPQQKSLTYSADHCSPHLQLLAFPWSVNRIQFAKARGSDWRNVMGARGPWPPRKSIRVAGKKTPNLTGNNAAAQLRLHHRSRLHIVAFSCSLSLSASHRTFSASVSSTSPPFWSSPRRKPLTFRCTLAGCCYPICRSKIYQRGSMLIR
ncbi:unnamed protein product [Lactuca virosa]|uniref:Uncharacterized protein n=1 Tax=Lactuca virosa TaxID=75947 RepID=A0AAU9MF41_9ASTR|nr:unnamed protein product [Lactuca virosa]